MAVARATARVPRTRAKRFDRNLEPSLCKAGDNRRLINIAIPSMRDFRGLSPRSFDGRGNYTFGITEHNIFKEIDIDKVMKLRGMDVTIVTSARTDEEGRELLKLMNMPFRQR